MRFSVIALMALLVPIANSSIQACNIPVFRYALENWHPDPYQVFVLYDGALDPSQSALVDQLASVDHQPAPNMVVYQMSVQQLQTDAEEPASDNWPPGVIQFLSEWVTQNPLEEPTIVALYPHQHGLGFPAWHGELSEANVRNLIDSPNRQKIAQRVLEGQTAVWVLIDSGNPEKDDAAFQTLKEQLAEMPHRVSLPDQSLIEADEQFRPETQIELKVEFSLIRVSRDDVVEQPITSMLLGSEADLRDFDEPIAIPIYGRGRTYFALVGKGINAEMIQDNCQFLCGACSCQVKQENPGIDLLFAMNWQDRILGSVMNSTPLPELTGVGAFEVDEIDVTETPGPDPPDAGVQLAAVDVPDATVVYANEDQVEVAEDLASVNYEGRLLYWVGALIAVGIVFMAGVTVVMRRGADGR